jgi:hypothetical protein
MTPRQIKALKKKLDSIPEELDALAHKMRALGAKMEYYGGFGEMAQHGMEMQGAANIARGWAKGIRKGK